MQQVICRFSEQRLTEIPIPLLIAPKLVIQIFSSQRNDRINQKPKEERAKNKLRKGIYTFKNIS